MVPETSVPSPVSSPHPDCSVPPLPEPTPPGPAPPGSAPPGPEPPLLELPPVPSSASPPTQAIVSKKGAETKVKTKARERRNMAPYPRRLGSEQRTSRAQPRKPCLVSGLPALLGCSAMLGRRPLHLLATLCLSGQVLSAQLCLSARPCLAAEPTPAAPSTPPAAPTAAPADPA